MTVLQIQHFRNTYLGSKFWTGEASEHQNLLGPYLGNQTDMNVTEIFSFGFELELAEGFNEGHALNITHRPTELTETKHCKLVPKQPPINLYTTTYM